MVLSSVSKLFWFIRLLWQTDPDSRNLMLFTGAAGLWSLLQLITAYQLGSLLFLFSAFHLLHMAIEFGIGLASVLLVTRKSNFHFSFGYDRIEVLLRFSNVVFLLFLCLAFSIESFQHFLADESLFSESFALSSTAPTSPTPTITTTTTTTTTTTVPQEIIDLDMAMMMDHRQNDDDNVDALNPLAVTTLAPILGFLVFAMASIGMTLKVIGTIHKHQGFPAFLPSSSSSSSSSASRYPLGASRSRFGGSFMQQQHQQQQQRQQLISMSSDVLSYIAVFASLTLVRLTGYDAIEPLLAIVCACVIAWVSGMADLSASAQILLQTTPPAIRRAIESNVSQIKAIEGVVELSDEHFWMLRDGVIVGSLCIKIKDEADDQRVLSEAHKKLSLLISHLTIQVEKNNAKTNQSGDGGGGGGGGGEFSVMISDMQSPVGVPIEPQLIQNFMSDHSLHLFGGFGASHVCSDCSISSGPSAFVARVVTPGGAGAAASSSSSSAKFGSGPQLNMNSVIIPSSSFAIGSNNNTPSTSSDTKHE